MANVKISALPTYTGNTTGVYLVMNDSGNTTTYKVEKETLGIGGTHFNWSLVPNYDYSLAITATDATGSIYGGAVVIAPFTPGKNINISALTADIYGTASGGEMKFVVYSNDPTRLGPGDILIESSIIDLSTNPGTIRQYNVNYTFEAGTTYWLGMAANAAGGGCTMRFIPIGSTFTYGVPLSYASGFRYNMCYGAISTWPTLPSPTSITPNWAGLPEVRIKVA